MLFLFKNNYLIKKLILVFFILFKTKQRADKKKPMKQTSVKIHVKYCKYVVLFIIKLSRIVNFNTYFNKIP